MWSTFLPKVFYMSLTASIVILFVLVARLLIKQAPKVYSYALWAVVLFRLLCPVALTSNLSLLGIMDVTANQNSITPTVPEVSIPSISDPVSATNLNVNTIPDATVTNYESNSLETEQLSIDLSMSPVEIASLLWLVGITALLIYSVISLFKLYRKLIGAVPLRDNIYLADHITTPFVIGILRPRIYLPSSLTDREQDYILLHEQYHLKRFDHVVKLLAFAALCIHWFNPLVWVAFVLFCKDMEMSCDEAVIRKMGEGIRGDYSTSLLSLATGRRIIAGTPLAFGEGNTKARIKNALSWRKPPIRITVFAVAICITVMFTCAADPKKDMSSTTEPFGYNYHVENVVYDAPQYSFTYTAETAPQYSFTADKQLMIKGDILKESKTDEWQSLGIMSEITLTEDNFDRCFIDADGISGWRETVSAAKLRLDNQKSWQLTVTDDQSNVIYYVLQQKDGSIYLAYGYHTPVDGSASGKTAIKIRWLFHLSKMDGISCKLHTKSKETYCDMRWYPDGQFNFNYDELPNAVIYDRGSFVFTADKDIDTLTVVEDYYSYPGKNTGIMKPETYTLKRNSDGNFVLDVSRRHSVRDENAVYYIPYGKGKYVFQVLFPINSSPASTLGVTEALTDAPANQTAKSDLLDTAITNAILDYNKNRTVKGDYSCESHIILCTKTDTNVTKSKANFVTVYAMVLYQTFRYSDGALQEVGGSHIPTALSFKVGKDGTYTLSEYWEPRDGSYYAKDIQQEFPEAIQKDALDTQKFILAQVQSCYAKAIEHGKVDTNAVIKQLFEGIMSSPVASSNPSSFIKAHPIEYRELTYYGDYTLRYIFSEFMKGGQTGLKGQLMRQVMDALIGDEAIKSAASNGQEYFDAWAKAIKRMKSKYGLDYMKSKAPKAYLYLQLLND